ncbi:MAG: prepilin-type N-terminal cleavage/methylation domain-containing protein [Oligoflexales bacterium]
MSLGRKKSQIGVSMVEVLVALSVLAIAMAASNAYFGKVSKSKRKNRLRDIQKRIAIVIKNSLKSPADIFFSVSRHDKNPSLAACVLGIELPSKPGSNCSDVLKKSIVNPLNPQHHTFGLYKVTNSSGTSGKAITNPENGGEVFYDINGKACNEGEDNCVFAAESDFYVSCPDDPANPNCENGATQVFFSYQVRQVDTEDKAILSLGRKLPPYPKVRRYTSMSMIQIVGPQKFSECGSGIKGVDDFNPENKGFYATLAGFDETGKAKCECVYPFIQVEKKKDPRTGLTVPVCRILTAEELACGSNEYLRGIRDVDLRGGRDVDINAGGKGRKELICVGEQEAFNCRKMEIYDKCSASHWISQITNVECDFTCHYLGDQERTCKISWDHYKRNFDLTAGVDIETDAVGIGYFDCYRKEMYCCQPNWQGSGG